MGDVGVAEIIQLWLGQLYELSVLKPAWLLTPEGNKTLFSKATLWRILLLVAFAVAMAALAQTLPADLALIAAGDLVSYVEVAAIVWIATAGGRVRGALRSIGRGLRLRGLIAARRERRTAMRRRRQRRPAPPANDDGPSGERWTIAA
jgi:hypothetical protein